MSRLMPAAALLALVGAASPAAADCGRVHQLIAQGLSPADVAAELGAPLAAVQACLQPPRAIGNAAGPPPFGAAGPPPLGAAGPAPLGAAGPAPLGAAGPAPFGAAGPAPLGAGRSGSSTSGTKSNKTTP